MVPPDILYCTPDEILLHEDFNTDTAQAFLAHYVDHDVTMHFYFHGTVDQLLAHFAAIGIDEQAADWYEIEPEDDVIDVTVRDDIDPRFTRPDRADWFFTVVRDSVAHFGEYTVAEHAGRPIEDFLEEIGFGIEHMDVTVEPLSPIIDELTLAYWEEEDE